jgi:hypothetical protein
VELDCDFESQWIGLKQKYARKTARKVTGFRFNFKKCKLRDRDKVGAIKRLNADPVIDVVQNAAGKRYDPRKPSVPKDAAGNTFEEIKKVSIC